MAKYYNATISSSYSAKVTNDANAKCSLDEQNYDQYYDEIKEYTKQIAKNIDDMRKAVNKLYKHQKTGSEPKTHCKTILTKSKKVKEELIQNRNNLSKRLDAEFKRQIKAWIAWAKQQAAADNKQV